MTAPTDQFVDIANRSQEAVTTAVRTWADSVQSLASKLSSGQSQLPGLSSVVDQYFDFAEKMLANQREFAQQWAAATVKAAEAVTEQAQRATQSVATHVANGSQAVVDTAADTTRVAGEKMAPTADAADVATNKLTCCDDRRHLRAHASTRACTASSSRSFPGTLWSPRFAVTRRARSSPHDTCTTPQP
jgi:cell division septum initiation protein DivIVA